MASKSQRGGGGARAAARPRQLLLIRLSVIGGCIAGVVIAYLHVHFGGMAPVRAAITAATNVPILLVTYLIFRRLHPRYGETSLLGLLASVMAALPVIILAFFGLGFEIPEMADFGAMYILGAWIGSSEASARPR